jgi:hypothetical protein
MTVGRQMISNDCPRYRPDHNGECLNCDEWADAHSQAALKDLALVTNDDLLSEAQYRLRDGHNDHLSAAIAKARNCLNTPIRMDCSCGCILNIYCGPGSQPEFDAMCWSPGRAPGKTLRCDLSRLTFIVQ